MQWTCIICVIKIYYIIVIIIKLMLKATKKTKKDRGEEHGVIIYKSCTTRLIDLYDRVDGEM